jgi:hypothetical protein
MKTKKRVNTMTDNVAMRTISQKRMHSFMSHYQLDRPFLRGMGNLVDIFATTYDLDFVSKSDKASLLSDVQNIGSDMRIGIALFKF